ncbi:hypothetical protein NGI46_07245 [Peribacillus butanolivorans]|nr:hypothetical protein [Peribacillus butanolivorans]
MVEEKAKYFCNNPNYPYLEVDVFQDELKELEPFHIENFLCINLSEVLEQVEYLLVIGSVLTVLD